MQTQTVTVLDYVTLVCYWLLCTRSLLTALYCCC